MVMARHECIWCGEPLRFVPGRGWVHEEGGSYVMRCRQCGWKGAPYPSPAQCPRCGSEGLRDDHCALERRS
jgi:DNA-directed RNA polymerase subunit RPC12/RpoP